MKGLTLLRNMAAEAWRDMRTHRLRTGITFIIISLGIMVALVGTLTVVRAIDQTFAENLKAAGTQHFVIRRYASGVFRRASDRTAHTRPPLTLREALLFKRKFNMEGVRVSVSFSVGRGMVENPAMRKQTKTDILAVDEDYAKVHHYKMLGTGSL